MRIKVGLMAEAPIVVAGLARFLDEYDERNEVVLRELPLDTPTIPEDVDLVLYDVLGPDRRYIVIPPALDGRVGDYSRRAHAKVILFGWQLDPRLIESAIHRHKADGYISKGLGGPELVAGLLRAARESEVVVMLPKIIELDPKTAEAEDFEGQRAGLSAREEVVIRLIAQGLSNQEIALTLHVSLNTLKFYIRSAYRKLGLKRRGEAVAWATSHGYATDDTHRNYTIFYPNADSPKGSE